MKKLNVGLSFLLACMLALSPLGQVRAAWDSTQPGAGSSLASAPVRGNFAAMEGAILEQNYVRNGDLWDWTAGTSSAPDNFTLAGSGATIAETGAGQSDTTTLGGGRNAAKITRVGNDVTLTYTVISATDIADMTRTKGQTWQAAMLAKTSTASHVRITINDGVGTSSSSYHTGGGGVEWLRVTRTIDAAATKLEIRAEVNTTNAAAYVGGFMAIQGNIPPSDWSPMSEYGRFWTPPRYKAGTSDAFYATTSGRLTTSTSTAANSSTTETNLLTYTVKGNTLSENGKVLKVTAWFSAAANANTKTIKFYYGTQALTVVSTAVSSAWSSAATITILRSGSSAEKIVAEMVFNDATIPSAIGILTTGAIDNTADQTIKFTGTGGASSDLTEFYMVVEVIG